MEEKKNPQLLRWNLTFDVNSPVTVLTKHEGVTFVGLGGGHLLQQVKDILIVDLSKGDKHSIYGRPRTCCVLIGYGGDVSPAIKIWGYVQVLYLVLLKFPTLLEWDMKLEMLSMNIRTWTEWAIQCGTFFFFCSI